MTAVAVTISRQAVSVVFGISQTALDGKQPLDATLTSIALLGTAADRYLYTTGVDVWAEGTITAAGRAILDDANAAAQRTTLGLVTIASSGSASDLSAGTVATARLGTGTADGTTYLRGDSTWATVTSGTTDHALLASNLAWTTSAHTGTAGSFATFSGAGAAAVVTGANADIAYRAAGVWTSGAPGSASGVQPYDAELLAIAGLTSAADKLPYFTGSGTADVADFTAAGRALVDDANAAAQRTTLGLVTIASSGSAADLTAGQVPFARLGSGTADGTKFLRDDLAWTTVTSGTTDHALLASNLAWTTSAHTGTAGSFATFSGAGAAAVVTGSNADIAYRAAGVWTSGAPGVASGVQPYDASLTTAISPMVLAQAIYAQYSGNFPTGAL